MNETHLPNDFASPDDDAGLDPRDAAALLDQTTRRAHRQFELTPPLLTVLRGLVVFLGYGAVWYSVRDQHPYQGPSGAAVAAIYGAVILVIVVSVKVIGRATRGVSGPSQQQMKTQWIAVVIAYIATGVFQGALQHDGASHAIVYGVFPAAAPLLVVGATLAGTGGTRSDWPIFAVGIGMLVTGTAAAFAGPVGAWAVAGIGMFVAVLAHGVTTAWSHKHA